MTNTNPWKWLSIVSTCLAVVLGVTNVVGLPACNDIMSKAEAKDVHKSYEQVHKETLDLIHSNAIAIGVLEERTRQ